MRPRNPAFLGLEGYPFARLEAAKRDAAQRGRLLDFGAGDPIEPTPGFIREAMVEAASRRVGYPPAAGEPRLRAAITSWLSRRFGAALDPEREILPSNGSKEAIYGIHQAVIDPNGPRRIVWVPDPGYPVYAIGAAFAGGEVRPLPLREQAGFLPDLNAVPEEDWRRTAIVWLNYPSNPTGATVGADFYAKAAALARRHGFWLASDEAYSEIWFDEPPPSLLQQGTESVVIFNTLSKRSSMTGYRSGMIAGDPDLIRDLRTVRPSQGVATPLFIQAAAVAAWGDEAHVERQRSLYRAKREILAPALARAGWRLAGGRATFYLWAAVRPGRSSEEAAALLLDNGIVVAPGSYFGAHGEGYIRIALVPTLEECREAAQILEGME